MDSNAELVRRCIAGEPEAFDRLVREYMNTVLGLAYNYTGDYHTAQDLAQETFIQAFQSIEKLRDGSRFKIWLLRIARNKCIDHIRRKPRWLSLDETRELRREAFSKAAAAGEPDGGEGFTEEDLISVLQSLRKDYREIFVMKHIDNLSYREIAELLHMTVSAVGEKLYRVRSMIRERLMETKSGSNRP